MDRRVDQRWFTPPRLAAFLALVALAAAGTFLLYRYGLTKTLHVDADRIAISTVTRGAFHDYVPLTGNVQPRETVYLDAVDGGQVVEIFVEEGAIVTKGEPLARLNNSNLQLQMINSEAQLSEALNRLTSTKLAFEQSKLLHARELIDVDFQIGQARQRLGRIAPLVQSGAVKRAEIEDLELEIERLVQLRRELAAATKVDDILQREQMEQLDRAVKGLNANLDLARRNLENLVVKAPLDGQLTSLEAHLGESKLPGQRLGQIDQIDAFKVVAFVDEHYLGRVTAGQDATADFGGSEHRMRVAKVFPEVRERQFKIDLEFADEAPAAVRRGQTMQLRLEIGASSEGLIIANGAFFEDTGGQWAFVLDGETAERRAVRFGRRNPDQIEIIDGLSAGDRVITSSYQTLKQFDRLELQKK